MRQVNIGLSDEEYERIKRFTGPFSMRAFCTDMIQKQLAFMERCDSGEFKRRAATPSSDPDPDGGITYDYSDAQ